MKSRLIVKLQLDGAVLEWTPTAYLYEGVRLKFTTNRTWEQKVTASLVLKEGITTALIGDYVEERYLHKGSATFDFSSYLTQLYQQNLYRLMPYKADYMSAGNIYLPYFKRKGEDNEDFVSAHCPIAKVVLHVEATNEERTIELDNPFLVLAGDNAEAEDMCAPRTHMLPVNFPSVVEYIPIADNTITIKEEGKEDIDEYGDNMPEDNVYTFGANLSELIDKSYYSDIRAVYFGCPSHLETQSDEVAELTAWTEGTLQSVLTTNTRADMYIVDNRTKGCFLRFFDRFGFVSQILLDVVSEENSYSGGSVAVTSGLDDIGYVHLGSDKGNYRLSNTIQRTTEQRLLHCTLERVTKDLRKDLEDLACSPCVLMYEGESWREVSLTCGNITDSKKESLIDFACDVTIGGRQRW